MKNFKLTKDGKKMAKTKTLEMAKKLKSQDPEPEKVRIWKKWEKDGTWIPVLCSFLIVLIMVSCNVAPEYFFQAQDSGIDSATDTQDPVTPSLEDLKPEFPDFLKEFQEKKLCGECTEEGALYCPWEPWRGLECKDTCLIEVDFLAAGGACHEGKFYEGLLPDALECFPCNHPESWCPSEFYYSCPGQEDQKLRPLICDLYQGWIWLEDSSPYCGK